MSKRAPQPDLLPTCISAITPDPRRPGIVVIKVGRRVIARVSAADATDLALAPGQPLTPERTSAITTATLRAEARGIANRLLARRPLSRSTLSLKLIAKGFEADLVASVVAQCQQSGLINDKRLAHTLAEGELARTPAAPAFIERKLRSRGIDRALAARAAAAAQSAAGTLDQQALELAKKKARTLAYVKDSLTKRRRLYQQLARRGFDHDTTARAVDKVLGPSPHEE